MRRGQDSPGPCMGPLVSATQKERVLGFVTRVRSCLLGGSFEPALTTFAWYSVCRTHVLLLR